ncbi:MAG TPA: capsular biosynthesis protein [Bacteroidales bacterium]|nr:capsular biosynthesis protein [Bacteroidales bacterium]
MSANNLKESDHPIDAVILWVDGNDPVLTEKRNNYLNIENKTSNHSGALPTRFISNNEIRYCVLSILTFASFVRNIFIVTDDQDPNLNKEIDRYFPGRSNTLRIVDHKEIFSGFEQYLPSFNSSSIESMIWRIKGLSENFIYFNDDVFLIRKIRPEDWFSDSKPVLRGKWKIPPYKKMLSYFIKIVINKNIRKNHNYQPRLSFYLRQWKAAKLVGMKFRYYFYCHIPHPLNKKRLENFFTENKELLEKNISYRFRSEHQFIMPALAYHLEILNGNKQFAKLNLTYLHPYYSNKRLERKISKCENDACIKSVCVQSLEIMDNEVQERIFKWMDRILSTGKDDRKL